MKPIFALLMLLLVSCNTDPRNLTIQHTSPVEDGVSNERMFFGFVVADSHSRLADLTGSMRLNGGERIVCEGREEWRNTIIAADLELKQGDAAHSRSGWEFVFRCPYDVSRLPDGDHQVHFAVSTKHVEKGRDREKYAEASKSLSFTHDGTPPAIYSAYIYPIAGGSTIVWDVDPSERGFEVEGYRRGVRVFSSRAHQGSVAMTQDVLPYGSTLELRVWDRNGNQSRRELSVP